MFPDSKSLQSHVPDLVTPELKGQGPFALPIRRIVEKNALMTPVRPRLLPTSPGSLPSLFTILPPLPQTLATLRLGSLLSIPCLATWALDRVKKMTSSTRISS